MLPSNYQESLICVEQACQLAGLSFRYIDTDRVLAEVTYPNGESIFFIHNKNPFNSFTSARVCQDKALQAEIYTKNQISHPKTKSYFNPLASKSFDKYMHHHSIPEILKDISANFKFPFFIKKNISSLSKDVHLVDNKSALEKLLHRYLTNNAIILLAQEKIIGPEYRVISWKGEPLLAYQKGNKFSEEEIKAPKIDHTQFQDITQKIYKTLNIDFFGADIIDSENGLVLIETNANPACFYYNKYNGRADFTQVYLKCLQEYQS